MSWPRNANSTYGMTVRVPREFDLRWFPSLPPRRPSHHRVDHRLHLSVEFSVHNASGCSGAPG